MGAEILFGPGAGKCNPLFRVDAISLPIQNRPMPIQSLVPRISTFTPTGEKVLCRRTETGEIVRDGIILPENRIRVGLARALVLAVGAKIDCIKKGDTILFPGQNGYAKVEVDGKVAEVVPLSSIFAVEPK